MGYEPAGDDRGASPRECQNCGRPGFEHDRVRRGTDDAGRVVWGFDCPEGDA